MNFGSIGIRFVRPDVAIARIAWRLLGDSRIPDARTETLIFVVVKNRGNWEITAAQNTDIHRTVH